jgi:hypothetical protein
MRFLLRWIEFTALQIGMLDKQPFCRREGHRQDMLGHRLGRGAAVARNWQRGRQLVERNPIDAGSRKLQ